MATLAEKLDTMAGIGPTGTVAEASEISESGDQSFMSGADETALSRAFFASTVKHNQRSPSDKELITRFMRGIGPMRHMYEMPGGVLEHCLQRVAMQVAPAGTEIMSSGDINKSVFIVISGTANLLVPSMAAKAAKIDRSKKSMSDRLTVCVLGATDLADVDNDGAGWSDPFATLQLAGLMRRTKTRYNCKDPEWDTEPFEFWLPVSRRQLPGSELPLLSLSCCSLRFCLLSPCAEWAR